MITKATLEDIPALKELINSAYRGESSKTGWTTEANLLKGNRIDEDELEEILANEENTILKLTQNNKITACVLLIAKEKKIYLGMLTVAPELQNAGIGRKLLEQAQVHALALGKSKIEMTVISVREELIAWYKRNGYQETGEKMDFPANLNDCVTSENPLEFIILEKTLYPI